MQTTEEVIEAIRSLVKSKGYLYSLSYILFRDFRIDPERLHEFDPHSRLGMNEAALLLGFLIQSPIDFSMPDTPKDFFSMQDATYDLLADLHKALSDPFSRKIKDLLEPSDEISTSKKDMFGHGKMFVEPIFYASTGLYDFQYLDFLDKKYLNDKDWLVLNRSFVFAEVKNTFVSIKNILQKKSEVVQFIREEALEPFKEEIKSRYPPEEVDEKIAEMCRTAEYHQFMDLIDDKATEGLDEDSLEFQVAMWKSFYKNLLNICTVSKNELKDIPAIEPFVTNFSVVPSKDVNQKFNGPGDYNIVRSNPLIAIDGERFFLPITFFLAEAIYESPFYWMMADTAYKAQSEKNRGNASETITFEILRSVFGNQVYKSIKVKSTKAHTDTDIDVLCVLGNKALCVQVKSQKLTELSRKGNDLALTKDFDRAVQAAYVQAKIVRQKILEKNAKFYDEENKEIKLSEEIDEVYLAIVTTENFPSLVHQTDIFLKKEEGDPNPLVTTVFDLELTAHYLKDPFDLLYYIRQRTSLAEYYRAEDEMAFLAFHLLHKLWRNEEADLFMIPSSFASIIDRNYYPLKAGLELPKDSDPLEKRWQSKKFDEICKAIKTIQDTKITDIIFHLYDLSGNAREMLANGLEQVKSNSKGREKGLVAVIPPAAEKIPSCGIGCFGKDAQDINELRQFMTGHSVLAKYKAKADIWIAIGAQSSSRNIVDGVAIIEGQWKFDQILEESSKYIKWPTRSKPDTREKIGRNDPCPCGSGRKFKKCCIE